MKENVIIVFLTMILTILISAICFLYLIYSKCDDNYNMQQRFVSSFTVPSYDDIKSKDKLATAGTTESIAVYLLGLDLRFEGKQVDNLEIDAKNEDLDKVFEYVYETCILYNIVPQSVMFSIKPHSSEHFTRAWNLSREMLKAL